MVEDGTVCLFPLGPGDGDPGPKAYNANHADDKGAFVVVPSDEVGGSIIAPKRGE